MYGRTTMPDLIKKEGEEGYENNNSSTSKLPLIVSKDTDTLSILTRFLKAKSLQVYGFTNSLKALEHSKKRPEDYCIAISDTRMREMQKRYEVQK